MGWLAFGLATVSRCRLFSGPVVVSNGGHVLSRLFVDRGLPDLPAATGRRTPPSNLMRALILAGQIPFVTVEVAEQRSIHDGSWP